MVSIVNYQTSEQEVVNISFPLPPLPPPPLPPLPPPPLPPSSPSLPFPRARLVMLRLFKVFIFILVCSTTKIHYETKEFCDGCQELGHCYYM